MSSEISIQLYSRVHAESDTRKILVLVDLIRAFAPRELFSDSSLPVDGLTLAMRNRINRLIRFFAERRRPVIFLCDRHTPEQCRVMREPPHALVGSTEVGLMDWVLQPVDSLCFFKSTYDGTTNAGFAGLLAKLSPEMIYVAGTSTGVCVKYTVLSLARKFPMRVSVVEDCCADMFPGRHRAAVRFFIESPLVMVESSDCFL